MRSVLGFGEGIVKITELATIVPSDAFVDSELVGLWDHPGTSERQWRLEDRPLPP